MKRFAVTFALMLIAGATLAHHDEKTTIPAPVKAAIDRLSTDAIRAHVKFLSDDLLEGRGPGTRGDALAVNYIATQFEAMGLKPDGDNGTYLQKVPLIGTQTDGAKTSISFTAPNGTIGPLKYLDEYVGTDLSQVESSTLDSEIVFVGHGVVAPEYKWDDYKGLDTRGKTLVMLVDDPPASAAEPDLFKGKARTYYGRWTYKYEMGAQKNAQGVILIHTDQAAGYPWQVVRSSWGRERAAVARKADQPALKFASWITKATADKLFQAAGHNLDQLMAQAHTREFKPVSLGHRLTGTIVSTLRPFQTHNVIAKIEGSDPKLRNEAILYTAHHDHLGVGLPDSTGDNIYNGAVDNATGTGLLIELARAWSGVKPAPKRSIIFAAVAAEEQGLLGSEYYGQNPTVPAGRIALNLNFDAIQQIGRVKGITLGGVERTTFLPTAERVTKALSVEIVPDPAPEQGSYYRSDHFSLGKVGVPAFSIDQGDEVVGKSAAFGRQIAEEYTAKRYHQPSDEIAEGWDWSSSKQMAEIGIWLGWEAANAPAMPNWVEGDEFRAVRDRSLAALKK